MTKIACYMCQKLKLKIRITHLQNQRKLWRTQESTRIRCCPESYHPWYKRTCLWALKPVILFLPISNYLPIDNTSHPLKYISALFLTIHLCVFRSVHSEEGEEIGERKSVISFTYWKPFKSSNYAVCPFFRLFISKAENRVDLATAVSNMECKQEGLNVRCEAL